MKWCLNRNLNELSQWFQKTSQENRDFICQRHNMLTKVLKVYCYHNNDNIELWRFMRDTLGHPVHFSELVGGCSSAAPFFFNRKLGKGHILIADLRKLVIVFLDETPRILD